MVKACGVSSVVFVSSLDMYHTRAVAFLRYELRRLGASDSSYTSY